MQAWAWYLVSCLLVASGTRGDVLGLYSSTQVAQGTWYEEANLYTGACSIPTNDMSLRTVAIQSDDYQAGAVCGMCVKITGKGVGEGTMPINGTFTALVADSCPSCSEAYSLDLADPAAQDSWGLWDISWVAVDCPVGSLTFSYQFQGSNSYYVKIKVINPLIPVQAVNAMSAQGAWVSLTLSDDGWFYASSGNGYQVNPIRLQITSIVGETVEESLNLSSIPANGPGPNGFSSVIAGSQQFEKGAGSGTGGNGNSAALLRPWLTSLYYSG